MGYTHYWHYNPQLHPDQEALAKAWGRALLRLGEYHDTLVDGRSPQLQSVALHGPDGHGYPVFNHESIAFNGSAEDNESFESFVLHFDPKNNPFPSRIPGFGFCKTARRPYDLMVGLTLIALAEEINHPETFRYSSDGDEDDWSDIVSFYTQFHGTPPVLNLESEE